jgi:hypothetical protein
MTDQFSGSIVSDEGYLLKKKIHPNPCLNGSSTLTRSRNKSSDDRSCEKKYPFAFVHLRPLFILTGKLWVNVLTHCQDSLVTAHLLNYHFITFKNVLL